MPTRLLAIQALMCGCALWTWSCQKGFRSDSTMGVPRVEWTVELTGAGLGRPMTFTYQQLAGMEMTRLDHVLMQKTHGPDEITSWRGPSVETLLAAARIKPGPMTLILEAADGYRMTCSRADMRSAILALQDGNGRWLGDLDETRPIRLVAPDKTGDYWIANPARITVEPTLEAGPSG